MGSTAELRSLSAPLSRVKRGEEKKEEEEEVMEVVSLIFPSFLKKE